MGSLRDREVASSTSDRQGSNFESCVWRAVSSHLSHHPQEVLLAQFSLYVHRSGIEPDLFHLIHSHCTLSMAWSPTVLEGCAEEPAWVKASLGSMENQEHRVWMPDQAQQTDHPLTSANPVNKRCSHNVALMLGQRRRQWRNIKPTL